ncbi:hypothetical protein [Thermus sp. NEB1569]|uniref:hypothetical protein n=1 Tax=Thermus sp. NEB1569 TaxID=2918899 RepID=UPI001EFBA1E6|nr:hypothetical protein [Thermus sp. NEB1569]ULR40551.1 hypothetical protein MI302_10685 [Thermus sp. NEB1569]
MNRRTVVVFAPLSVIHSEALHAATLATQVGGKPSRARTWATKEKAVTTAVTCRLTALR